MNYRRVFIQNSFLHIIIVSYNRNPIFIQNINLLRQSFKNTLQHYNFKIIAICVLPNHIHLILNPEDINKYPKIISSIKYYFSRNIDAGQDYPTCGLKTGYRNKREKGIFQRRYFEHTITDEKDLNKHIDYIHYNPVKHGLAKVPKDWEYSSFKKFVQEGYYDIDWCNAEDKNNITQMEIE